MSTLGPKYAVTRDRNKHITYYGTPDTELRIELSPDSVVTLTSSVFTTIYSAMTAYNPLLDAPASSLDRLQAWLAEHSTALFGRDYGAELAVGIHSVMGGEGLLPMTLTEYGPIPGEIPSAPVDEAVKMLAGRECVYKEKSHLALVKVLQVDVCDDQVTIKLEVLPAKGFSGDLDPVFKIGGSGCSVGQGCLSIPYVSATLITHPAKVEKIKQQAEKGETRQQVGKTVDSVAWRSLFHGY